jgi:VCBS repeat protein
VILVLAAVPLPASANDRPSSYARLEVGVANLGENLPITVVGSPGAPFALAASSRAGERQTRFGRLCLDPRRTIVLANGVSGSGPTLDSRGRYDTSVSIPSRRRLLATAPVFQAAVVDARSASGIALSRSEMRSIGNGSHGDFRGSAFGVNPGTIHPYRAIAGDVDGDGYPDLFVWAAYEWWLLVNDRSGGFVDGTSGATTGLPTTARGPTDPVFTDIDGDGDLDIIYGGSQIFPNDYRIHLLVNDGHGRFTDGTDGATTGTPLVAPTDFVLAGLLIGDFDGDGSPDVIVIGDWRIYLNDGHGRFRDARSEPGRGWESRPRLGGGHAATGDFDGNGTIDFIAVLSDESPHLYLNDGNARFHDAPATSLPAWPDPYGVVRNFAVGDIDRDGDLDIVVATYGSYSRTWMNDGAGHFVDETFLPSAPARLPLRTASTDVVLLIDVDRDGDVDLIQGNIDEARNELYLNDGFGYFSDTREDPLTRAPSGSCINDAISMDFDRDGDPDVLAEGLWEFGRGPEFEAIFVNR